MQKSIRPALIGVMLLLLAGIARAQEPGTVYLKDGSAVRGIVTAGPDGGAAVSTPDGRFVTYSQQDIKRIKPGPDQRGNFATSRWGSPAGKAVVFDIDFGYGLRAGRRGTSWISPRILLGAQFNPHCFIGLTTGGDFNSQTKTWCIPLALNFKGYLTRGDVRPFLSIDAGYAIDPRALSDLMDVVAGNEMEGRYDSDTDTGGWLVTPSVGLDIRVSRRSHFYASAGYRMQSIKKSLFDGTTPGRTLSGAIDLRIGICFVWGRNE